MGWMTVTLFKPDYDLTRHYDPIFVRVYHSTIEDVPDIDSINYTYLGVDGERAPNETIVLVVHPISQDHSKVSIFKVLQDKKGCLV